MKIAVTHHGGMCAAWHGRYAFGCIINDVVRGIIAESSAEQVAVQELQVGACLGSGGPAELSSWRPAAQPPSRLHPDEPAGSRVPVALPYCRML